MTVIRLDLNDYRNYRCLNLGPSPGLNLIVGPNAQGKTNLIEALATVATTRVLRGSRDGEVIREGAESARVTATYGESETALSISIERGSRSVSKKTYLNGMAFKRASDALGRLPLVCVSAADLAIVQGEPADRRLFLDLELSQIYPAYFQSLAQYRRALEQRNALLRAAEREWVQPEVFEVWEAPMAKHGATLRRFRQEFSRVLALEAGQAYRAISGHENLGVGYEMRTAGHTEDELFDALAQSREADTARGSTSVGPHRDDLNVEIEGRSVRLFGSQGQQRSAALAIKLGAWEHGRQVLGARPILLLDDVFSDLDAGRRGRLFEHALAEHGQVFLTCPDIESAAVAGIERATVFEVRQGEVTRR